LINGAKVTKAINMILFYTRY